MKAGGGQTGLRLVHLSCLSNEGYLCLRSFGRQVLLLKHQVGNFGCGWRGASQHAGRRGRKL